MLRVSYLSFGLFLLVTVGCGGSNFPDPVPVSGAVTYKGTPVEDAKVTFLSRSEGGRSASGRTDAQGNYELTTFNTGDGAIPGEYTVTISKPQSNAGAEAVDVSSGEFGEEYGQMMQAAASGTMEGVTKHQLPEKYAKPAESGLQRTVVEGQPNEFTFDLE